MIRIRIHIGEVYASANAAVIETILGSCVSVCMHDRKRKVGGMNHILLPGKADMENFDGAARYGINAMEMLINEMLKLGAGKENLRAKLFGGAHIIQSLRRDVSPGLKNVNFIEKFLRIEGIPIQSRDTGGVNARRIYFHTDTGDVYLKTIPAFQFPSISWEEQHFEKKVWMEMHTSSDSQIFEHTATTRKRKGTHR
jgi:chemotaxis protein CheD